MVDFHRNPFDLLSEDAEEEIQTKKKQSKEPAPRKPVVFPGDLSGKKKKGTAAPPPSKEVAKPAAKSSPNQATKADLPSKPNPPKLVSTSATLGNLVLTDVKATRSSINQFLSALEDVLGGPTILFKLQISSSSNDYYHKLLREKPYQAIGELIKTDKFNEGLLGALRLKWSAAFEKSTDLRNKPLSIRVEKKLSKSEFVEKLVSLLGWAGRKKNRTVTDASRLVYDLLDPVFGIKPEDNKYISRLEENLASEVGSQGNLKSGGTTLADFIVTAKPKQKKKKGTQAAQAQETQPSPPVAPSKQEQETQEVDYDPIYNPETISKSIPFGWQFGVLTKTFLRRKAGEGETNEQGGREWYYLGTNEEIDNAIVFWNNVDVVFLFTTGSEW